MIEIKNVTKVYYPKKCNKKVAIDNISFSLPNNGLIFLLGKSGSGKSTLLNLIGTLDKPTSGSILFNGENISDFSEKKLTNYRSSHVGFVFQEFNLLDEFNVYDNINLVVDGKQKNVNKHKINKCLNLVGLNNFGHRKVGDLSGGEKQRVAVARALIKEPSIILADEPTGNLDSTNSCQIFNIFKEISKSCLVVVVSHDKDSAFKYADSIIEIEDGKIINNTIKDIQKEFFERKLIIKPHIGFIKRIKLAFGMLKVKKIKLIITILLLAIAFSLFSISYSFMKFNIPKTHAETMIHENERTIILNKGTINNYKLYNMLTKKEINDITRDLNSKYYIESYLYSENKLAELKLSFNPKYTDLQSNAYYSIYNEYLKFLTFNAKELGEFNIIGTIPNEANEVLISELLADYLTIYGFKNYSINKNGDVNYYDKFVETKEDLIGEKVYVENGFIVISGIIKDEKLKEFEVLKSISQQQMKKKPTNLYNKFRSLYENNLFNLYISEEFINQTSLKPNYIIDRSTFENVVYFDSREYYDGLGLKIFSENLEIYDGNKLKKINSINDGEIILSSNAVEMLSNGRTVEKFQIKAKELNEDFLKKVKEREQKIKEQQEALQNDPNYIYHEIPEIEEPNLEKLIQDIIIEEIKTQNIIGKEITIEMLDKNHIYSNSDSIYHTFKIIGVVFSDSYSYVGQDMINYSFDNFIASSVYIDESNEIELINIFEKFDNKDYEMKTRFSSSINSIAKVVYSVENISNYILLVFLIFSVLLLIVFVSNNLNVHKRKIGILRALGISTSEVVKIFMLEGVIIAFGAFILSMSGTIVLINFVNNYITKELFFFVRPVIFYWESVLNVVMIIILVIIISLILPTIKLSKCHPIDLIRNNK